jgi:uncharacterized membrane protein
MQKEYLVNLVGAGAASSPIASDGLPHRRQVHSVAWRNLKPDSSALFLQPEKVLAELKNFRGNVIRTSLSSEQEEQLQQAISGGDVAGA